MPALDAFHSKQTAYAGMHDTWWAHFAEQFTASVRGEVDGTLGNEGYAEQPGDFTRRLCRTLDMAENYYCAPLMNRLVTAAAEEWVEDEAITEDDFPSSHGWVLVPGGLTTVDIRGRTLRTEAISWSILGSRVLMTFWADKRFDPPWMRETDGWEQMPQYTPWHLGEVEFNRPLPRNMSIGKVLPPEISEQVTWVANENPDGSVSYGGFFPSGFTREELAPGFKVNGTMAWLVSMLRIMQQPLASSHTEGMPAHVRAAFKKERYRVSRTLVTVIDFRRRESDFDGHSEREYTHRFLRRGHWRRQPYKREDGTWDRRRTWIHATIVGDPSLPLILREHVNALRR